MSRYEGDDAEPMLGPDGPLVETVIVPGARDLGGFEVRRALPSKERQMVGPFVFFDHMGPAVFHAGRGLDVRPHPHIGLATVTYLLDGEIMHRDSLGTVQAIQPGAVNWMTAGRGIVHSERTAAEFRAVEKRLYGVQAWVALPQAHEETAPDFSHIGRDALPEVTGEGKRVRVIAGEMHGVRSPVKTFSDMIYADAALDAGASLPIEADHIERAVYVLEGSVKIGPDTHEAGRLLVLRPGDRITVRAQTDARMLVLGGEPMDGPRHVWWNLVSSRRERIEQAKSDWRAGRFDRVAGDAEFIPLPE